MILINNQHSELTCLRQYLNTVYLITNNNIQHLENVVRQQHFQLIFVTLGMHVLDGHP